MTVNREKLQGIVDRGFNRDNFDGAVNTVMRSTETAPLKYDRLTALIDEAARLIAPATPCRKGCGNCCKIAVSISEEEAVRLAQHTGRAMRPQGKIDEELVTRLDRNAEKYYGVRCPFLGEQDECTVYVVRPVACRAYHSLNDTAAECAVTPEMKDAGIIPTVNLHQALYATAFLGVNRSYGDIRDYFETEAEAEAEEVVAIK
jgi:hypothetical protein